LPDNVHINLDLLRRITGIPPEKLKQIVGRLDSLGFSSRVRKGHDGKSTLVRQEYLELEFMSLDVDDDGAEATELATTITTAATEGMCSSCAMKALQNLDFGQLSSATYEKDSHKKAKNN
jgi:hypothetical protein